MAGDLVKVAPTANRAEACVVAAGVLARCVPLAENDVKLPETERSAQAQSYAGRAVAGGHACPRRCQAPALPSAGPRAERSAVINT